LFLTDLPSKININHRDVIENKNLFLTDLPSKININHRDVIENKISQLDLMIMVSNQSKKSSMIVEVCMTVLGDF
jgi:hypothetical protein